MKLIRTKFESGERYSLLIDDNGVPNWYPTLFATSKLRNSAKASNTIEAYLNAVKLLLEWCHTNNILLEETFLKKQFLTTEQIEGLCIYLRDKKDKKTDEKLRKPIIQRKEFNRAKIRTNESVSNATTYIRISYIANYLDWFAKQIISERNQIIDREISHNISCMVKSLKARRPSRPVSSRSTKKGLAENQRSILLDLLNSNSSKEFGF